MKRFDDQLSFRVKKSTAQMLSDLSPNKFRISEVARLLLVEALTHPEIPTKVVKKLEKWGGTL